MSDTSAAVTSTAVGMALEAALAWERVVGTAREPPFPGELTVGFMGELKAPTAALMVPALAVVIDVLLAVSLRMKKGVETRKPDSPLWKELFVAFCLFLLALLEHWVAVLCVDLMTVHVLHFYCCGVGVGLLRVSWFG